MTELPFNPGASLLVFPCAIEYQDIRTVWLALDTGASLTVIRESALSAIGYSFKAARDLATFGDASQTHIVPKVTLKSLSLADARVENIEALCYTLPEEYGIDGLIGLNFLRQFNIGLDFGQGILTLNHFG